MVAPMGEEVSSLPHENGLAIFLGEWWPLLLFVLILAFCLVKPLGGFATWMIRGINNWIHQTLFYPGAKALLRHEACDDDGRIILRWLWFAFVFGTLILGISLAPSPVAFGCALVGSCLALSVGGFWVGAESRALGERDDENEEQANKVVHLANNLQIGGILSLFLVLVFITWSFKTADEAFNWYDAPDASFHTWINYALHLIYQAVVNLGDVWNFETSPVKPVELGGQLLVTIHFVVLTFLVINGLTLIARCEHAIRSWIHRLRTSGTITGVRRFGSRVWDDLLEVSIQGKVEFHSHQALYALGECIPPSTNRIEKNPTFEGIIGLFAPGGEDEPEQCIEVRLAAASALGTWQCARAFRNLAEALRAKSEDLEIRSQAATSLGRFRNIDGVPPVNVRKELESIVFPPPEENPAAPAIRTAAIGGLIMLCKENSLAGSGELKDRLKALALSASEPDTVNAKAMHALRELKLLDNETEAMDEQINRLNTSRYPDDRREAAVLLGEFGDLDAASGNLIAARKLEDDVSVKEAIVNSLGRIVRNRTNDSLIIEALLEASWDSKLQVRSAAVNGLHWLPFEGKVAERLCEMAEGGRSEVVIRHARQVIAVKNLDRLPLPLANRCRRILRRPELSAAEEAVAETIYEVLAENPELAEKLGPKVKAAVEANKGTDADPAP